MSSDGTFDPVKDFREQALIRHNLLRSKHVNTGPLKLDQDLCQVSVECVQVMLTIYRMQPYGQIIWRSRFVGLNIAHQHRSGIMLERICISIKFKVNLILGFMDCTYGSLGTGS